MTELHPATRPPLLIAHRGASAERPENTMSAFRRALEVGADGIELDVQQTVDGALVVVHDLELDRTTTACGLVMRTEFSTVRWCDAGSWFDPAFAGERVPLLKEVLELPSARFEIELKGFTESFADAALAAVVQARVLDRVEFTSPHPLLLQHLRASEPTARIGCFAPVRPPWMGRHAHLEWTRATAEMLCAQVVHFPAHVLDQDVVGAVRTWGFAVHAADVPIADLPRVVSLEVDQLSTDDPMAARHLLNDPHLRECNTP